MVRWWSRNRGGELLLLGLQIQVDSDKQEEDRVFVDVQHALLTWSRTDLADKVSSVQKLSSLLGSFKV